MGWTFKEENLDLVLVPSGILIMSIYHGILIIKYRRDSKKSNQITTSIGYENHNKKAWEESILELDVKDRGFAVMVLNSQISAAATLTSISLTLCALIGVLLGKSTENLLTSSFIFGSTSKFTNSIKYVAILSFFILAFACFVQTTRHFAHASFLISTRTVTSGQVEKELKKEVLECIQLAVLRGSNFWAVGLRALYFATNLLLWIFGPIPMFVGSLVLVVIMHHLDVNKIAPINYGIEQGRQILDGILVANEIVNHAKKASLKLLLFKVDFEKAFDSVNWNFLLKTMEKMGFGRRWMSWMKGCLSSATVSVLVNACEKGLFNGISLGEDGTNLSLLQFADDALIFGEWSRKNIKNLISILNNFRKVSGLAINLSKSILYGIGVSSDQIKNLALSLNCKGDVTPFKYLGLPGRQILDGILVANEIVNHAKKASLKLLLFKVDFEKAFDSVNWNFLLKTMEKMGFGRRWMSWMKGCLSSATVSVLVNACEKGLFNGISLGEDGTNLSLLQFADDALIFGEWSRKNIKNLISILNNFRKVSGLAINLSKSILYGIGVSSDQIKNLALSLNCKGDVTPFKYLGLPVGKDMSKSCNWTQVIEKFTNRLSSWKANCLSFGGRLTLIKSVLGSLPLYYPSLFRAPKKVLNTIESIRCRVFLGFKEESKGIYWVKWRTPLASYDQGGLGIGSTYAKNLSLLGKWWWRFHTEKEALWCRVISYLYGCEGGLYGGRGRGLKSSDNIWKANWDWRSSPRGRALSELQFLSSLLDGFVLRPQAKDGRSWALSNDGLFTVNRLSSIIDSAYLSDCSPGKTHDWISLVPRKINIFIWRLVLDRLPLLSNLDSRCIDVPSVLCPLCGDHPETREHLFIACSKSLVIWRKCLSWWGVCVPPNLSIMDLVSGSLGNNFPGYGKTIFSGVCYSVLWHIWDWRNKVVHSKIEERQEELKVDIFPRVQSLSLLWLSNRWHCADEYFNSFASLEAKDRGFALSVLGGQLSASTSLSSISLVLCSLIGALLGNSSNNFLTSSFILGDTSQTTSTIKYISILSCFLLAFACFIQTIRHFVHANFLISIPTGEVPVECIQTAVLRGSNFWAAGLRALYFALTLLLWIFGPIPMFVGSIVTVIILHCLDTNSEPLIQYGNNKSDNGGNIFQKIGHELSEVVEALEHRGRP
ncbi:reverse transcriptase domain, Reverse transcriptase zinc-binding domain protein [Artemisia annua]|uniref:Reverse transcriptase domain, Reverse transcriptase zinc-binding domain protein n=1 Tax=Artemisia annua TaxID=35608 RepID=A0A2U1Q487_ARTAN|nr:reverse transcriptase domain, Reverse transcriptase zinc-binding domain protein [Artemisia annua]